MEVRMYARPLLVRF